ncbi:hypothetical protein KIN20_020890 [Parelaphostrongylus tenuis]|uniref:Uncharacterized protein n=1 Tax=Parelaphostrongylus tenuis TaxID=148309 RepID=A0AAD5QVU2_PARTN|nr:hypothetical protein KIN20_020890 [Parelaphostrongylus tenuis]
MAPRAKRLLMLQENRLDSRAAETFRRIKEAWGVRIVGRTAVFDHFNGIKAGNGDFTYKQRAGRPPEIDQQGLNATETSPSLTTCMLSDDPGCRYTAVENFLHQKWSKD